MFFYFAIRLGASYVGIVKGGRVSKSLRTTDLVEVKALRDLNFQRHAVILKTFFIDRHLSLIFVL